MVRVIFLSHEARGSNSRARYSWSITHYKWSCPKLSVQSHTQSKISDLDEQHLFPRSARQKFSCRGFELCMSWSEKFTIPLSHFTEIIMAANLHPPVQLIKIIDFKHFEGALLESIKRIFLSKESALFLSNQPRHYDSASDNGNDVPLLAASVLAEFVACHPPCRRGQKMRTLEKRMYWYTFLFQGIFVVVPCKKRGNVRRTETSSFLHHSRTKKSSSKLRVIFSVKYCSFNVSSLSFSAAPVRERVSLGVSVIVEDFAITSDISVLSSSLGQMIPKVCLDLRWVLTYT